MPLILRNLRPLGAAALLVALALTSVAPGRTAAAPSIREVQRLEDLARIWIYVDLFDPYLNSNGTEWDQALIEAIPAVRTAGDASAHIAALNAMLRRSGDPSARVLESEVSSQPLPPPLREQNGTWIADCSAMAHAVLTGAAPLQLAENIAAHPTVVDCRAFAGDGPALYAVIAAIARTRTKTALPAGSALVRSYNGFPSEAGTSSAGFASGFSLITKGSVAPGTTAPSKTPLVFIIDTIAGPALLPAVAALQSAGQARIVSGGPIGAGVATLRTPRLTVQISEGLYTYPAGAVGFRPDATATAPSTALRTAIAELSASPSAILREPALPPLQRSVRQYKSAGVPPAEQRLLALFRIWGTINYFHPYKSLTDRPWDTALTEFIPVMLAANTRAAYEAALLRLAARTQDGHTRIEGLTEAPFGFGATRPGIRTRFVEGRLVIVGIDDPTLASKLRIGDEILSVDNTPIGILEQRLLPFVASATPQAFRAAIASRVLTGSPGTIASLLVRSVRGALRTVRVSRIGAPSPQSAGAWHMLPGNVGYIDLERLAPADADRALDELADTKALIFDLRGTPQRTGWAIGARLAKTDAPFAVAKFRRASYQGPPKGGAAQTQWIALDDVQRPAPVKRYAGRVFALIDERTASQAEHTALIFKAAANATFVGSTTNGTIGDLTAIQLPGGLILRFTGHDVRTPDGRQLQRNGIKPDVAVTPGLRALRAGRDAVLEKALDLARK